MEVGTNHRGGSRQITDEGYVIITGKRRRRKNYIPREGKMAGRISESEEGDREKKLPVKNVGNDLTEIPPNGENASVIV